MNYIKPPWTDEQVRMLQWWQNTPNVHPYTCLNRGDGKHLDSDKLTPTVNGWICEKCEYTQDWAHDPTNTGLK